MMRQARPSPLPRLARAILTGGSARLAGMGLAFGLFVLTARLLGPEAYGVFSVGFTLATLLGVIASAGRQVAIQKHWPEESGAGATAPAPPEHADPRQVACLHRHFTPVLNWSLLLIGTGLLLAVLDVPRPAAMGEGAAIWPTIALLGAALAVAEFTGALMHARGQVLGALVPREIIWRAGCIAALGAVALGKGTLGPTPVLGLFAALLLLALSPHLRWIARSWRRPALPRADREERRTTRRTARLLWLGAVATAVLGHAGTVLTGLALGPAAAGAYFAADRLSRLLSIAQLAAAQIVPPLLARSHARGDFASIRWLMLATAGIAGSVALAGFGVYALIGRPLLEVFDPGYDTAFASLLWLSAGRVGLVLLGLNRNLLEMSGREGIALANVTLWGLAGLPAMWLAMVQYGMTGGAAVTAAVLIGMNLTGLLLARRTAGARDDGTRS